MKIRDQATGEERDERVLFLDGVIAPESWFDDEVSPAMFRDELNAGSGDIVVWINSPGGDCVAAAQIYNMLMEYKGDVTVKIDGIAASAASVIAMAGTKVCMSPVSMMMCHNPGTFAAGNAAEMQKVIDMLEAVKESIMNAYEIKTGLSRAKISHMMDAETWMDARKAVELGFADEILQRQSADEDGLMNRTRAPMLYSREVMTNQLIGRAIEKCRIQGAGNAEGSGHGTVEGLEGDPGLTGTETGQDSNDGTGNVPSVTGQGSKEGLEGDHDVAGIGNGGNGDKVKATGIKLNTCSCSEERRCAEACLLDTHAAGGKDDGRSADEIRERLMVIKRFIGVN